MVLSLRLAAVWLSSLLVLSLWCPGQHDLVRSFWIEVPVRPFRPPAWDLSAGLQFLNSEANYYKRNRQELRTCSLLVAWLSPPVLVPFGLRDIGYLRPAFLIPGLLGSDP